MLVLFPKKEEPWRFGEGSASLAPTSSARFGPEDGRPHPPRPRWAATRRPKRTWDDSTKRPSVTEGADGRGGGRVFLELVGRNLVVDP